MNKVGDNIKSLPKLSLAIFTSVLAFLFKGLDYLFIGSSVPFILGICVIILIIIGFKNKSRTSRRIFRIWGWMLAFWGISRLVMELMFKLTSITEEHIQNQFTLGQKLLSVGAIIIGIYIIRKVRSYRKLAI